MFDVLFFVYEIQHCFIRRRSDSTVSEDARIEPRARICKRLWSSGIGSGESIPPAYVAWQAGTTNRVVVPARQAGIDSWAP